MPKIIYYVATSIDGFIAGPNENIDLFAHGGKGVETYLKDLQSFSTVIMGRKTYEFGYKFGLKPGALAYPHMKHYIFSESLDLENKHEHLHVRPMQISHIEDIKKTANTDIYLCGGGRFAAWLLKHKMIDQIKVKLNPIILGAGTKLFEGIKTGYRLNLQNHQVYEGGLQIITYEVVYS